MNKLRVVLDTNVLVSALLSPLGNPAKIFMLFLTRDIDLVVSTTILAEYADVLARPRLRIPEDAAARILAAVRRFSLWVEPIPGSIAMVDEDDRIFYDVAKNTNAILITGNTKHYPQEPFIMTPTDFLTNTPNDRQE